LYKIEFVILPTMVIAIVASGTLVAGASVIALGGDRDQAIYALALALLASLETAYAYATSLAGGLAILAAIGGAAFVIATSMLGTLGMLAYYRNWIAAQ
jgi:hypothetical protein